MYSEPMLQCLEPKVRISHFPMNPSAILMFLNESEESFQHCLLKSVVMLFDHVSLDAFFLCDLME